ncbi:RNA polymerase sigma factor [Clostridium vincentii]|uniref:RNA polymerase sigma factor SigM n=1 Tax=Clostridium vincentii TaxID=52704 RepID=A0A2T0BHW9_9CLOT|nr:sigma-70 family RNA polymerase sigma factor [Clostridium vincentii]PRR83478.1 RNA polymerase sigma factor SigM [Clostridium vincentii]
MQDIEQIYKEYADLVYRYLKSLTRNEDLAQELMQETFYRAIIKINQFRGECKISTWLCQIGKYLWYQRIDKDRKQKEVCLDELEWELIENTDMEKGLLDKHDKLEIYKKIQYFDKDTKDVMLMRLTGDLSFAEIGQLLNRTENWARVTYYRGKQKIKKGIETNE